jgi:hypothetical protein
LHILFIDFFFFGQLDGTLKGACIKDHNPFRKQKMDSPIYQKRAGSLGAVRETPTFHLLSRSLYGRNAAKTA